MAIKLVVSDIDGTLINEQHVVTPKTKAIVNEMRDQGVEFMIATGRNYESAAAIAEQFGRPKEDIAIISLNGMFVDYPAIAYHQAEKCMSFGECCVMEELGNKYHMGVLYCFDDVIYFHMDDLAYEDFQYGMSDERMHYFNATINLQRINSLEDIKHRFENGSEILKMVYIQNGDYVELVKERVSRDFPNDYNLLIVGDGWAEIMPRSVNKGDAMLRYAAYRGYKPEEIVSFGDSDNDLTLIDKAGTGVAMANARNSLKVLADALTLSNSEDGVADYIEKNILK